MIRFNQSTYMETYIMRSKPMRMKATKEMENDFPKLIKNSVYGKTW